ncbi:MAG: ABC transporter ATP-binding protein [Coriobacteriaceae bacterium]|jgi:iron complex transport system ATP-binding protein|nr:ABC transporter ATP-binding protein [Coriobacteriaceae bacterium]
MALSVENLSCGYGGEAVISGLSFDFEAGKVLSILGPNGIGKTTLFKTMLGFLKPQSGSVSIDGTKASSLSRKETARLLAYVPQSQVVPFSYPVEEFILMGRAPHLGLLQQPGLEDREIVHGVMCLLGIEHLAAKSCTGISGGELQLAFVARALAQQPRYLIMDEPTANLDYGNQTKVLECILGLAQDGIGIVMTTHNPEQAFILESQVVLLQGSREYLCGSYKDILTEERLHDTYDIDVLIRAFTHEGKDLITCRTLPKCNCKVGRQGARQ